MNTTKNLKIILNFGSTFIYLKIFEILWNPGILVKKFPEKHQNIIKFRKILWNSTFSEIWNSLIYLILIRICEALMNLIFLHSHHTKKLFGTHFWGPKEKFKFVNHHFWTNDSGFNYQKNTKKWKISFSGQIMQDENEEIKRQGIFNQKNLEISLYSFFDMARSCCLNRENPWKIPKSIFWENDTKVQWSFIEQNCSPKLHLQIFSQSLHAGTHILWFNREK